MVVVHVVCDALLHTILRSSLMLHRVRDPSDETLLSSSQSVRSLYITVRLCHLHLLALKFAVVCSFRAFCLRSQLWCTPFPWPRYSYPPAPVYRYCSLLSSLHLSSFPTNLKSLIPSPTTPFYTPTTRRRSVTIPRPQRLDTHEKS